MAVLPTAQVFTHLLNMVTMDAETRLLQSLVLLLSQVDCKLNVLCLH